MVYLCKEGACDYVKNTKKAYEVLEPIIKDEKVREERLKNIDRIRKPNATRDIVSAMFESVGEKF